MFPSGAAEQAVNLHRHFIPKSLLIVLLPVLLLAVIAQGRGFTFKTEVDPASFTTIPLLLLAVLQLYRTQRSQQASSIKEFLGEFRKDDRLYSIYFDLIYSYRNDTFEQAQRCVAGRQLPEHLPDFAPFKDLQGERSEGSRIYMPGWFGLSPEERRLDALFDYINAVGFYHDEGLIEMRDIARILGDYLAVFEQRRIVWAYLAYCEDPAQLNVYKKAAGAAEPYIYVRLLLSSFKRFNEAGQSRREIRALQKRIRSIKLKRKEVENGVDGR